MRKTAEYDGKRRIPGPKPGRPRREVMKVTAKERALAMLNRRDYSRAELLRRLVEKGEDEAAAAEAVERLAELGFVDDARYAPLIVRHYAAKGYGAQRVRMELQKRGIPRELWDAATEEMPVQDDAIDRLLRAKLKSDAPDRAELKRATDALLRKGYGWDEIKSAVARYHGETEGLD